jgi:hypothetical protein
MSVSIFRDSITLKKKAACSSETSVSTKELHCVDPELRISNLFGGSPVSVCSR